MAKAKEGNADSKTTVVTGGQTQAATQQPAQPQSLFGRFRSWVTSTTEKYPEATAFVTSRTWTRIASLTAVGVALGVAIVGSGGLVIPAVAVAGTIAATCVGIARQVKTHRNARELAQEDSLLNDFNNNQVTEALAKEKNPKLVAMLDEKLGTPLKATTDKGSPKKSITDPAYNREASVERSAGKNFLERGGETLFSISMAAATLNPVAIGISLGGACTSLGGGTVSRNLVDQRKTNLKMDIDARRPQVNALGGYNSLDELREIAKQQKIKAEVLKRLANNDNVDEQTLQKTIAAVTKEVNKSELYKKNADKGFFKKAGEVLSDVGTIVNPFYSPKNIYNNHTKEIEQANAKHRQELEDMGLIPKSVSKGKDVPAKEQQQAKDKDATQTDKTDKKTKSDTPSPTAIQLTTESKTSQAQKTDDKSDKKSNTLAASTGIPDRNAPPPETRTSGTVSQTQSSPTPEARTSSTASQTQSSPTPASSLVLGAVGLAAIVSGAGIFGLLLLAAASAVSAGSKKESRSTNTDAGIEPPPAKPLPEPSPRVQQPERSVDRKQMDTEEIGRLNPPPTPGSDKSLLGSRVNRNSQSSQTR